MFLTGDIERFGKGILGMIKRSKETDLIAPEFVINEGFMLILCRPSTTEKTIHDTKFIAIENLSHRVVWLLNNEMSRNK
jgi:predicted HTH transcriptional regulator